MLWLSFRILLNVNTTCAWSHQAVSAPNESYLCIVSMCAFHAYTRESMETARQRLGCQRAPTRYDLVLTFAILYISNALAHSVTISNIINIILVSWRFGFSLESKPSRGANTQ